MKHFKGLKPLKVDVNGSGWMKFKCINEVYDLDELTDVLCNELAGSQGLQDYTYELIDNCYGDVSVADSMYHTSEVVDALGELDLWEENALDFIEEDVRSALEHNESITICGLTFEPVKEGEGEVE